MQQGKGEHDSQIKINGFFKQVACKSFTFTYRVSAVKQISSNRSAYSVIFHATSENWSSTEGAHFARWIKLHSNYFVLMLFLHYGIYHQVLIPRVKNKRSYRYYFSLIADAIMFFMCTQTITHCSWLFQQEATLPALLTSFNCSSLTSVWIHRFKLQSRSRWQSQ